MEKLTEKEIEILESKIATEKRKDVKDSVEEAYRQYSNFINNNLGINAKALHILRYYIENNELPVF